ncbi:MAG TPA: hypothetical protein PKA27_04480 [Fimbriimonadaceae bacterium]|nr:hypothetical protein [Fimbriimonadaceae bacterium]
MKRSLFALLGLFVCSHALSQTCLVQRSGIHQLNLETGLVSTMIVSGIYPSLNSDGSQFAYIGNDSKLWISNIDGSNRRQVSMAPDPLHPSWSPNDEQLAVQLPVWMGDVFVLNADGSDIHSITYQPQHDWWPTWSPDGDRIAFCRIGNGPSDQGLYTIKTDRTELQYLGPGRFSRWGPDGKLIALGSASDLRIVDLNGNQVSYIGQIGPDAGFCFTPDMSRVVVTVYGSSGPWSGYVYSVDGGGSYPLVTDPMRDPTCPRFQAGKVFPRNRRIVSGSALNDHGLFAYLRLGDGATEALFPDPSTLQAQVELVGLSSVRQTNALSITWTSKVERPGLAEVLRGYDYTNARWQTVFGRVATQQFVENHVELSSLVPSLVSDDREVKAQIEWAPLNDEDPAQDGWLHVIDQFYWTVQ